MKLVRDGKQLPRILLVLLLVLSASRLTGFVYDFGKNSLQMDFAAFYTAGQSVLAGVSPYENQFESDPAIWDGISPWKHSRFLYPTPVAMFFAAAARLPYAVAKVLWMGLTLLSFAIAMLLAGKLAGIRWTSNRGLLVIVAVLCYHPLLPLLERGQIDALTLAFIAGAVYLMLRRRRLFLSGLLLAAATVFKLHALYLLPFVLLRRQFRTAAGYLTGLAAVILLSFVFFGIEGTSDYLDVELPRISQYGEAGTTEMLLAEDVRSALPISDGTTVKGGHVYQLSRLEFVSNATLLRTGFGSWLASLFDRIGLPATSVTLSMFLFGVLFCVTAAAVWRKMPLPLDDKTAMLYWGLALVVVMLTAPLTWVTNTVWLIVLLPIALQWLMERRVSALSPGAIFTILGLMLAGMPDHYAWPAMLPFTGILRPFFDAKYVIALMFMFIGILMIISRSADEANA